MSKFTASITFFVFLLIVFTAQSYSHPAWGIVVDRNKQIYFTDLETVYKINSQGKLSIFRAGVSGRHVHDLAIDAQDNIYGFDNTYEPRTEKFFRGIWKISQNGEYTEIAPLTENLPPGMSVWRDFEGNTFSVEPYNNEKRESKIIKRTAQGKTNLLTGGVYGFLDGKKGTAKLGNVVDMAFAADNSIYVSDSNRIRQIDKDGLVKTIYDKHSTSSTGDVDSGSRHLYGLAVDRQKNVLVADFGNRVLLKIDSNAVVSTIYNSEKDWAPLGVTTFDHEIFILEARPLSAPTHTGNRVVKISADNKSSIITTLENTKNLNGADTQNNFLPEAKQTGDTVSKTASKIAGAENTSEYKQIGFYGISGLLAALIIAIVFVVSKYKSSN